MEKDQIDLHGVRHGAVQELLDQFLFDHFNRNTSYVTIITGKSDTMKEVVYEILDEYELIPEEDFLNSGQLNVKL